MNRFTYYTPTKIVFGKVAEKSIGKLIKEAGGTRVLLHYGGQSAEKSGLLARLRKHLHSASLPYVEMGGVVANPRLGLVEEGIRVAKQEKADFILAVGGGSVIDSAKAIGYGLANEGSVWDLYAGRRSAKGMIPVGVVLTNASTGSEMGNASVITHEKLRLKRGYEDDYGYPAFACMNPGLTLTLPAAQTAAGCVDILFHTVERYLTARGTMQLTDRIAEGLMRTVIENAYILQKDPKNFAARAEIMWAGSLSNNGLTGCGNGGGD